MDGKAGSCGDPSGKGSLTSLPTWAMNPGALEYLQLLEAVLDGVLAIPSGVSGSISEVSGRSSV
jgi:hypothetical protein